MKLTFPLIVFLSLSIPSAVSEEDTTHTQIERLTNEANSIVMTFSEQLKQKLLQAIQAGGFEHAVSVCADEAPKIADGLGRERGWSVKRVSLKPRNSKVASPDEFETKVLKAFDNHQQQGQSTNIHVEVIGEQFRYMKAISTGTICLSCHGESVDSSLKQSIKQYYPGDMATGYASGQIRGAFSLIKLAK